MKRTIALAFLLTIPVVGHCEENQFLANLFRQVNEQCRDYTDVLAGAMWRKAYTKSMLGGEPLSADYKQSLFKYQFAQCVTVNQLLLLKGVKQSISPMEWLQAGGEKSIEKLEQSLSQLIP